MSQIINKLIEHQITNLYGNDFQKFVEKLYTILYGTDFTPVKQKRDQGSDGLLNSKKTVLAIYAPEKRDLRKFQQKVTVVNVLNFIHRESLIRPGFQYIITGNDDELYIPPSEEVLYGQYEFDFDEHVIATYETTPENKIFRREF